MRGEAITTWVKPIFVAEVKFTEWTNSGEMRHPVYLGLRAANARKRSCANAKRRVSKNKPAGAGIWRSVKAYPGSLDSYRGICGKSPEHDADHGEADECSNGRCVAFEVASQATVTTDPRERSFDDPPFRQHLKSSSVRSLDDLQAPGTSAPHRHRHLASRVSAVSKNAFDERE